jgi:hypothetical protein
LTRNAEKIGGGVGGAIGKLVGGKKGAKVGREIGSFAAKAARKIFGFQAGGVVVGGGKVRITPVKIRSGYVMGGQVVSAKPKRKSRRKK